MAWEKTLKNVFNRDFEKYKELVDYIMMVLRDNYLPFLEELENDDIDVGYETLRDDIKRLEKIRELLDEGG